MSLKFRKEFKKKLIKLVHACVTSSELKILYLVLSDISNSQVRISIRNQTSSRRIPSASEFVKFLKTDESLHSFYVCECELYCLANILGLPLNLLTWSGQGAAGAKWDTYEPHQV